MAYLILGYSRRTQIQSKYLPRYLNCLQLVLHSKATTPWRHLIFSIFHFKYYSFCFIVCSWLLETKPVSKGANVTVWRTDGVGFSQCKLYRFFVFADFTYAVDWHIESHRDRGTEEHNWMIFHSFVSIVHCATKPFQTCSFEFEPRARRIVINWCGNAVTSYLYFGKWFSFG